MPITTSEESPHPMYAAPQQYAAPQHATPQDPYDARQDAQPYVAQAYGAQGYGAQQWVQPAPSRQPEPRVSADPRQWAPLTDGQRRRSSRARRRVHRRDRRVARNRPAYLVA